MILFCLPLHTTHALQPLDVAVFKSFKDQFFKSVHASSFSKKNFIVSKGDFAAVVKEPFEKKALSISRLDFQKQEYIHSIQMQLTLLR